MKTLLKIDHETPMLLSAAPLLQTPRVNVLATTYTGRPRCCDSARTAPPPRSGPVGSQRLPVNVEETILSRPPRAKIAPPPPPSTVSPVASPSANRMFCTTSRGVAWSSQWDVVQVCCRSQVFWYRIRRCPPPLSVTLPRPSRTTRRLVLTTFAVCPISIRTGAGPQRKRMIPPLATARTTARDVQLRAVPLPTQRSGWEVSTARAPGGTGTAAAVVGSSMATATQAVVRMGSRRMGPSA